MTVYNVYAFTGATTAHGVKEAAAAFHSIRLQAAMRTQTHTSPQGSKLTTTRIFKLWQGLKQLQRPSWAITGYHIKLNDSFNFPLGLIKYTVTVITGHHRP